jgi:hypothetical protein
MTAAPSRRSVVASPPPTPEDALAKLDAFLVDNEELEELNARLATFDLLHALRIERAETASILRRSRCNLRVPPPRR